MNKRKIVTFIVLSLFTISSFLYTGCNSQSTNMNADTIATVNGEPIAKGEFEIFINTNTSKAHQLLAKDNPSYTDLELRNKTWELAWKDVLEAKAYQILAKEAGLMEDISYHAFLQEMEKENNQRKQAYDAGKIVYGLVEYDEVSYQSYRQSNLILDLQEELAKTKLEVSEEEIRNYYDNIEYHEEIPTIYTVDILTFPYEIDPEHYEDSRNQAQAQCQLAYEKLCSGQNLDELQTQFSESLLETKEYSTNVKPDQIQTQWQIYQLLPTLLEGDYSAPIEANGGFSILQMKSSRQELGKDYEDMDTRIRLKLQEEKFNQYFSEYQQTLSIEILSSELKEVIASL